MKVLWDGLYSFITSYTNLDVYSGIATNAKVPYVVLNVDEIEPFNYQTERKGIAKYEARIEVYTNSMQDTDDQLATLWEAFESVDPTVSGYTFAASYRSEYNLDLDVDQTQSGRDVWLGTLGIECWISTGEVAESSSSSSPMKSSSSSSVSSSSSSSS